VQSNDVDAVSTGMTVMVVEVEVPPPAVAMQPASSGAIQLLVIVLKCWPWGQYKTDGVAAYPWQEKNAPHAAK
jgi:hypothetical protein